MALMALYPVQVSSHSGSGHNSSNQPLFTVDGIKIKFWFIPATGCWNYWQDGGISGAQPSGAGWSAWVQSVGLIHQAAGKQAQFSSQPHSAHQIRPRPCILDWACCSSPAGQPKLVPRTMSSGHRAWKFGDVEVMAALIATTSLPPNFQVCGEPHRPDDMAVGQRLSTISQNVCCFGTVFLNLNSTRIWLSPVQLASWQSVSITLWLAMIHLKVFFAGPIIVSTSLIFLNSRIHWLFFFYHNVSSFSHVAFLKSWNSVF